MSIEYSIVEKQTNDTLTHYKTFDVQLFAMVWPSLRRFSRWIKTQPENPIVSFKQSLAFIEKTPIKILIYEKEHFGLFIKLFCFNI
jgi:hypothetical protein